jgi:hypothetical protein
MGRWIPVMIATLLAVGTVLSLVGLTASGHQDEVTGLRDGCGAPSGHIVGGFDFSPGCVANMVSPDGRWRWVQTEFSGTDERYSVSIVDNAGVSRGEVADLADGMPYTLLWSPRPNWFFVNHHRGSFMRQPRVFEITTQGVKEHHAFLLAGQRQAIRSNPCLGDGSFEANWGRPRQPYWASGEAYRWSSDGRRLLWQFQTRIDACVERDETGPIDPDDQWNPVWMISDVETGVVDPASVRVIRDGDNAFPTDGPYADF